MTEDNRKRRIDLAIQLLMELKEVYEEISQASSQMESCSRSFLKAVFNNCRHEIQEDIDRYNSNIEEIKKLNLEATRKINSWHDFIKDESQLRKLLFPLKLYSRKRSLMASINAYNRKISEITIENRFIKERIAAWLQQLGLKAVQQYKAGNEYRSYAELLVRKNSLIEELKYLLPTIPDACPAEISREKLEALIERITRLAAA